MKHAEENILIWYVSCPFDVGSYTNLHIKVSSFLLPFECSYLFAPRWAHVVPVVMHQPRYPRTLPPMWHACLGLTRRSGDSEGCQCEPSSEAASWLK